jgi:hypothetical protein
MRFTEYYSGFQIKKEEIGAACGMHGSRRGTHGVSAMRPEKKRKHGRYRRRWEDNIEGYFEE